MALIRIIYDDKNTSSYQGVKIESSFSEFEQVFDSGHFPSDWFNAKKYYILHLQDYEPYLSVASSLEHFFFDGAGELYDSAWMVMDGENAKLICEYSDEGWEMFVDKGTKPTWEELKNEANKHWPANIKL